MRAGLRLLKEQEIKLATFRAALAKGEAGGVSRRRVDDIRAAVK